jgi:hypothetical protein
MFEAIVETIDYVQDVPPQLTESAIKAGLIRKGAVVGLTVHPADDESNRTLIEVKLTETGQEGQIKTGSRIPLEGQGGRFHFASGWQEYVQVMQSAQDGGSSNEPQPRPRAIW